MLLLQQGLLAQVGSIEGWVEHQGKPIEFARISLKGSTLASLTDAKGHFIITNIPYGSYILSTKYVGYSAQDSKIDITAQKPNYQTHIALQEEQTLLNQVVVTGTRTIKRQTETPIIVNVLDSKSLKHLQVCNLSESLKFQPGLRIETDCQTCNYTQLRMNGLQGGYSQILINGRPIFSPLMGLYGMEQLPANMIDRIEVVRGGGSSLYGSSAIGGTVNIITKIPKSNSYELSSSYQNTKGQAHDYITNANANWVNSHGDAGISFFINHRERDMYDANGDTFSEIPTTENTSWGSNMFWQANEHQKLEISLSNLNEYRYGGEMVEKPAYLAQQSEERKHKIWMLSADYQINFNDDNSSFITYAAWQNTDRKHYTGILPSRHDSTAYLNHIAAPPYGTSNTTTLQGGLQINHRLMHFLGGINTLTAGIEYVEDKVFDEIVSYHYLIDQESKNMGTFVQSDWDISPAFNLLSGLRLDYHNMLSQAILSPRIALLYKLHKDTQFRLSYGTGFRAPQAFDTDLHIAFAGGGISRVQLAPELQQERSHSWSASANYDKAKGNFIWGFTLEGFYTQLQDAFYLQPIGQDAYGDIFEKRNGQAAIVKGFTAELRYNYDKKAQIEAGYTYQNSEYQTAVVPLEGLSATKRFLRSPNSYGFANINLTPNKRWELNLNYVFTGSMQIAHAGGADNFADNKLVNTKAFSEINTKLTHHFHLHRYGIDISIFGGVKNIFDAYQNDFDIGKNRDSNYIYGPQQPRTFFVGLSLKPE